MERLLLSQRVQSQTRQEAEVTRYEIALSNQAEYRLPARTNRESEEAFIGRIYKSVTEILILDIAKRQNEVCERLPIAKK